MPSDSGSAWSPPASNSERRLSNSSDGSAGSGYSKATTDSADFLATRPHTAAVIPGKPAANPLQFIKVGPADLGSRAREQLRRAELAKRTEPSRIERQEDWQSNLDNWKSSRRKRVEHIIERCVEVRRMENEPSQPRGKSKTFNEMLEERVGRRKRTPLALYNDDDGHDLSDLGIGTSSTKSSLSEDCDNHSLASDSMDADKNHSDIDNLSNFGNNRKLGSSANEYDTCTTTTISSPEPEEYTYEGAIEGYKSRIISQTNSTIIKTVVNNSLKEKSPDKHNGDLKRIRTSVSNKIEEKLFSFEKDKSTELISNDHKKDLPKVDIHKRREQFEREKSHENQINKSKLAEISNKTTIRERLSNLEKNTDTNLQKCNDLSRIAAEVKPLKERLSFLEQNKNVSTENESAKRLSNGDLSVTKSLRDRMSSLKLKASDEEKVQTEDLDISFSTRQRLPCLNTAENKENPKIIIQEDIAHISNKVIKSENNVVENSLKSNLSGIENQMLSFCRSLDSLDINEQSSPSSFERIQSLEDFDCTEMQNNTVLSDIETEDSGIHTARDSCVPADDIADLTQIASPIGEVMISEYESSNEDNCPLELKKLVEPVAEKEISRDTLNNVEIDDNIDYDPKSENTDSACNYSQALSQPETSVSEDITEIRMDKEDEDTLKSLDKQDNSVIDALELAFQELDSESSVENISNMEESKEGVSGKEESSDNEVMEPAADTNVIRKSKVPSLYENIDIFYQNTVDGAEVFPLDLPPNVLEPPKEKPPPPPIENDYDDNLENSNFKHTNSARRIKKEIRNKRTSFLGIEGQVDDSYLDVDLTLAPRPDITSFLQEETKIEKLLYRKTLSQEMDMTLRESRDSGVDIERGPSSENWYKGHSSPDTSNPHSRQGSEPYTNVTLTSDEEETTKKGTEDISIESPSRMTDPTETIHQNGDDTQKIDSLDKKLKEQQARTNEDWPDGQFDDAHTKEVLRFERELLQLEQEELRRQRENLLRDQNRIIQKSVQDISVSSSLEKNHNEINKSNQQYRHSMPNLLLNENYAPVPPVVKERQIYESKRKPFVSEEHIEKHFGVEESRKVLYDDIKIAEAVRRPVPSIVKHPQLILPPKPRGRESIEREITMRSSRIPSAVEYENVERTPLAAHQRPLSNANGQYLPMSKHTLQALSAAPTPKLISNTEWIQPRTRKPQNYNYNKHWLIQEAEQRRIEEHHAKTRSTQRHSYHQDMQSPHHLHLTRPLSNSQQHLLQEDNKQMKKCEILSRPEPMPRFEAGSRPEVITRREQISRLEPVARSEPRPRQDPQRENKMLSVSGRRKCSHCGEELGRGAAMIIESLSLCYHVWCFTCAVCGARLGDGRAGADVRVRNRRLHCHHCYSSDDGSKYSAV